MFAVMSAKGVKDLFYLMFTDRSMFYLVVFILQNKTKHPSWEETINNSRDIEIIGEYIYIFLLTN